MSSNKKYHLMSQAVNNICKKITIMWEKRGSDIINKLPHKIISRPKFSNFKVSITQFYEKDFQKSVRNQKLTNKIFRICVA